MPPNDIKDAVDALWSAFEEFGIEDGYDIVAQTTLLLAVRRLDMIHTMAEKKSNITGKPLENAIFDSTTEHVRWSRLKNLDPVAMYSAFETDVLRFVRERGGTFSDVVFTVPSPGALSRLVDTIDALSYADPFTNGAVYEYLISRLTTKNSTGGFPTPRHLADLMVRLVDPRPTDTIADPASGSGGFLVSAANYLRERHPELPFDEVRREHFQRDLLHGFDNDPAFARISTMNLLLHGIEEPDIQRRDSLARWPDPVGTYSVVLTNPPFNGSVERSALDKDLHRDVKSTTKAPLFVGRVLSLLNTSGRAAMIVPEGVLFGTQRAQTALRKTLVEDHRLEAVIKIPSACYEPFSTARTAILVFTKTGAGGTDRVWFYEIRADGRSLDKKRTPVVENDVPDILARWGSLSEATSPELSRTRADQSFFVPRDEIAGVGDYLLTMSRYQAIAENVTPVRPPVDILADIRTLNAAIDKGITELEALLG